MRYYIKAFRNYANIRGRANRREYLFYLLLRAGNPQSNQYGSDWSGVVGLRRSSWEERTVRFAESAVLSSIRAFLTQHESGHIPLWQHFLEEPLQGHPDWLPELP